MALLMGPDLKFHMKMPNIRFDMGFIRLITNDYYTIGTSFKWFSLKAYAYNLEWRELFDSKVAAVDYVFRLKFFFCYMWCVFLQTQYFQHKNILSILRNVFIFSKSSVCSFYFYILIIRSISLVSLIQFIEKQTVFHLMRPISIE